MYVWQPVHQLALSLLPQGTTRTLCGQFWFCMGKDPQVFSHSSVGANAYDSCNVNIRKSKELAVLTSEVLRAPAPLRCAAPLHRCLLLEVMLQETAQHLEKPLHAHTQSVTHQTRPYVKSIHSWRCLHSSPFFCVHSYMQMHNFAPRPTQHNPLSVVGDCR